MIKMVFTPESAIVKFWVMRVQEGKNTLDEVPTMYNLREVVASIINGEV